MVEFAGDIEQPKIVKGEFFGVSIATIDKMVATGAGADEVMAYVVLARGVNGRGGKKLSTHGAKSIATRTGMVYRSAEGALDWLDKNSIVSKKADMTNAASPKHTHVKWILQDEPLDVYLANSLTDGIGEGKNNPPLMRIYNEVKIGSSGLMSNARLDAMMVLLHLYQYQDMATCGGVDPRAGIYREWVAANNVNGEKVTDIEGSNGALYEIEGNNAHVFTSFAEIALSYVLDVDDRHDRFWDAFHDLKSMGLLFEVTQIWSADPNGKDGKKAEPLYTLYVHDRHARNSEPYLQKEIHNTAFRTAAMDRYIEFFDDDSGIKSGRFRYIATKKTGGYPIGIYRLRFRPKTRDTGIGMDAEKRRVLNWTQALRELK